MQRILLSLVFFWFLIACAGSGESEFDQGSIEGSHASPAYVLAVRLELQKEYYASCDLQRVVPLRSIATDPVSFRDRSQFQIGDEWTETWLLVACDQQAVHPIVFRMQSIENQSVLTFEVLPAR